MMPLQDKRLKLIESPNYINNKPDFLEDINNDAVIVLFPSIPYWFCASKDIKRILELFDNGYTFNKISKEFSLNSGFNEKIVRDSFERIANMLFNGGVLQIDRKTYDSVKPMPKQIYAQLAAMISLTNRCNLSCPHCFINGGKPRENELRTEEVKTIIDDLKTTYKRGRYKITFTGGEPFLREDLPDILKYVTVNTDFQVEILTNGTLLDDNVIKLLPNSNKLFISVSLDGHTKYIHEKIRGKNTFEKTIQAIKLLVANKITVNANVLIHHGNVANLDGILELACNLGVKSMYLISLLKVGRAYRSKLKRVPDDVLFEQLYKIVKKNKSYYNILSNSRFASMIRGVALGIKSPYCGVGKRGFYIDSNGDIYPCPNTTRPKFRIGNIRKESISNTLKHPPEVLEQLRRLEVSKLNEKCKACPVRYFCAGECRGETEAITGSLYPPSIHCKEHRRCIENIIWMLSETPDLYNDHLYMKD